MLIAAASRVRPARHGSSIPTPSSLLVQVLSKTANNPGYITLRNWKPCC